MGINGYLYELDSITWQIAPLRGEKAEATGILYEKWMNELLSQEIDKGDQECLQAEFSRENVKKALDENRKLFYRFRSSSDGITGIWELTLLPLVDFGKNCTLLTLQMVSEQVPYYVEYEKEGGQERRKIDTYLKERTDNYLFEWDIIRDQMTLSPNWDCKFFMRNTQKRTQGQMIERYLMKEDIPRFRKLKNAILSGEGSEDVLLRFYVGEGENDYAWCNVSLISILYDQDAPVYVIGRIRDIDKKLQTLRNGNSNFYTTNGNVAKQKIEAFLSDDTQNKMHALLVISLEVLEEAGRKDRFWGETVISYPFVRELSRLIYPTDVLMTHDNYMVVFLGNIKGRENAERKAEQIHHLFNEKTEDTIRATIGIACWPQNGKNYEELLRYAEKPANIERKWPEREVNQEKTEAPSLTRSKGEPEGEQWPVSVVSDIVDDWYHMLYMNSRLSRQMELAKSQLILGQIKPHFIFNALANIKALIRTDPDLAENLTLAFTKYLRCHLNALGKENMVPFREVLNVMENYIQIEKSRFPGKINTIYDIRYDQFKMPSFIIQPLAENAIKHGLCKKDGPGVLRISSYLEDGYICIEVEDNGVGFEQMPKRTVDSGIGVENVRRRLAYLLDGSLTISSRPGIGTKAVIRFKEKEYEAENNSGG